MSESTAFPDVIRRRKNRNQYQFTSKSVSVCAVKGFGFPGVTMPPGNWVAPAGSYRSGGGGNETVGAFETTDRLAVRRSGRP